MVIFNSYVKLPEGTSTLLLSLQLCQVFVAVPQSGSPSLNSVFSCSQIISADSVANRAPKKLGCQLFCVTEMSVLTHLHLHLQPWPTRLNSRHGRYDLRSPILQSRTWLAVKKIYPSNGWRQQHGDFQYPLVNSHILPWKDPPCYYWEKPLFLWPFSIAICKFTRGYIPLNPIKSH